jgi:hypothetical protein
MTITPEYTQDPLPLEYGPDHDEGSAGLTEELTARAMNMNDVLQHYQFIDANAAFGYIVVADKRTFNSRGATDVHKFVDQTNTRSDVSIAEIGSAAPSPWTAWTREEHVSELRGVQGLTKFFRMKRNDGIVRGSLRALKTPLQAAHWFVKPGTNSVADKKIAEFVQDNLFCYLNVSWYNLLNDILLVAEYGYIPFEKVYLPPVLENGRFVQRLQKLGPRHPMDVEEWEYDEHGGPNGIWMFSDINTPYEPSIFIPISKLACFVLEGEAGDMNGLSVLRTAYKHWFYKDTLYKIDAIQKERHGIGIPVIKLPPGFSDDDKRLADEMGRNLRTNDRSHITLPPNWEVLFAKVEGQMVNCMTSIDHHDMAIMANVLGAWLKETKARADSLDMFMKSTRYIAFMIVDVINRWVVRELVDVNFKLGQGRKYPELVCRRIGEWEDLRTQSFTIRNLVGAGVIEPDDVLEESMREELDMPPKDPKTARKMITDPQSMQDMNNQTDQTAQDIANQKGSRQQGTPPKGSGRSNSGIDRSGG